jgi:hypothetical protein
VRVRESVPGKTVMQCYRLSLKLISDYIITTIDNIDVLYILYIITVIIFIVCRVNPCNSVRAWREYVRFDIAGGHRTIV